MFHCLLESFYGMFVFHLVNIVLFFILFFYFIKNKCQISTKKTDSSLDTPPCHCFDPNRCPTLTNNGKISTIFVLNCFFRLDFYKRFFGSLFFFLFLFVFFQYSIHLTKKIDICIGYRDETGFFVSVMMLFSFYSLSLKASFYYYYYFNFVFFSITHSNVSTSR